MGTSSRGKIGSGLPPSVGYDKVDVIDAGSLDFGRGSSRVFIGRALDVHKKLLGPRSRRDTLELSDAG